MNDSAMISISLVEAQGVGAGSGSDALIKSSQVKSSQVKSSQVKSSRVESSQVKSSQVKSSQVKSSQVESISFGAIYKQGQPTEAYRMCSGGLLVWKGTGGDD